MYSTASLLTNRNIFCFLVKSSFVKPETSCTVILTPTVSVLCAFYIKPLYTCSQYQTISLSLSLSTFYTIKPSHNFALHIKPSYFLSLYLSLTHSIKESLSVSFTIKPFAPSFSLFLSWTIKSLLSQLKCMLHKPF